MLDPFFSIPGVLARHRSGPLGAHIDGFASMLLTHGYARFSIRHKVAAASQFSRWLQREGLETEDMNEDVVSRFQKCHHRRNSVRDGSDAALRMLLEFLRAKGVIPSRRQPIRDGPIDGILREYSRYLVQERGLSRATVATYVPLVERFLRERFGTRDVRFSQLRLRDTADYILSLAKAMAPSYAKLLVTALRSFLRFLGLRGDIPTNLADAVPSVAHWRLSTIPRFLKRPEVKRLLDSCDRRSAKGQRDYAILLLLTRLGLRAGEVVSLRLDDIDWDAGELHVHAKGGKRDTLPIPEDVGKALATYLRRARPDCSMRCVFVRSRAPFAGLACSSSIDAVVRDALKRAGLDPPVKGAHLLRHSLATEMLGKGASLAEIGEVLRHCVPGTTEIYAKVDLNALRALAVPWPGGDV